MSYFKGSSRYAKGASTGPIPTRHKNKFEGSSRNAPGAMSKREAFRQKRKEDFNKQNIKKAGDFDFDQYNPKNSKGTHISQSEVRHLRQNHQDMGGTGSLQDTFQTLTQQKRDGAEFGKKSWRAYKRMGARLQKTDPEGYKKALGGENWGPQDQARYDEAQKKRGDAKERTNTFSYHKSQEAETTQSSSQQQNNIQDNDINSSVTGNNNYTNIEQDNSNRYYGGNTTNFSYVSNGEGPDTPATLMTLAGIGKPQDSPADTARFINKYSDLNADAQKKYGSAGMNIANKYIARGAQTNPIDVVNLDKAISQDIQDSYDQATIQGNLYQGDVFNFKTPDFAMPKPPKPIENNVEGIADKYKDDLDDID